MMAGFLSWDPTGKYKAATAPLAVRTCCRGAQGSVIELLLNGVKPRPGSCTPSREALGLIHCGKKRMEPWSGMSARRKVLSNWRGHSMNNHSLPLAPLAVAFVRLSTLFGRLRETKRQSPMNSPTLRQTHIWLLHNDHPATLTSFPTKSRTATSEFGIWGQYQIMSCPWENVRNFFFSLVFPYRLTWNPTNPAFAEEPPMDPPFL